MKTKFFKKIFSAFLPMLILLTTVSITSTAASGAPFSVSTAAFVSVNSNFTAEVKYGGTQPITINGIFLRLKFDKSKISCSPSSEKVFVNGMDGCVSNVVDGETIFMWESATPVILQPGKILEFTFQATQAFSATSIMPAVEMLYVIENSNIKDIDIGNMTAASIASISSLDVKNVITAINNIDNPVVLTDECNKKITNAWNSYCALSSTKKLLVDNYDLLVAAIKKYSELQQNSANDPVVTEINKYKTEYAYALSLTKLNATTAKDQDGNFLDIEAIKAAVSAMEKLSVQAQAKLMSSKNTMKSVLTYLEQQVKDELAEKDAAEREKQKRAAAKEAVDDYLKQPYKWVFELTVDTVKADDESGVRNAVSGLENSEINSYAIAMLADKKTFLQGLLKRIEELKISAEPEKAAEIIAADEFKSSFSTVLSMTPETVTIDEAIDVNIASYAYELLPDKVKVYLVKEGELLASLMDAVSSLPTEVEIEYVDDDSEVEVEVTSENPSENVKEVIKRITDSSQYAVKIMNRSMSKMIWVMLIAIGILTINFGVCYGFYRNAVKKSLFSKENEI